MITISEIKNAVINTSPHFFDSKTMKFFGQTMSSFKVKKSPTNRIFIYAKINDSYNEFIGFTFREFAQNKLLIIRNDNGTTFNTNNLSDIEDYISTH